MITRTLISATLALFFTFSYSSAQGIEEETGFKYVKGNYLFDSGRYDEAIQIYNDIIKGNPDFEEVLVYRGRAKYALGAYKGAKKDGLAHIELHGLSKEVCLLMGQAELGVGNPMIAISYLDYALLKDKEDPEIFLYRGNAFFELEDDQNACTDWHRAIRMGSDRARRQADRFCQRVTVKIDDTPIEEKEEVMMTDDDEETLDDNEVLSSGSASEEPEVIMIDEGGVTPPIIVEEDEEVIGGVTIDTEVTDQGVIIVKEDPREEPPVLVIKKEPVDDTVVIKEIDEDLDIKVYAGIGNRELKTVPDMLVLSDKAGQVVVDICVDRSGNVKSASLNRNESTIGSAGLISLALRKSREFKFDRARKSEQCGKLAFVIK